MKDVQRYDSIFDTELATIGLRFDGKNLVMLEYLDKISGKKPGKKPGNKTAERVKNKIEKYIDPKSKIKDISVDFELHVTDFQASVLKELQRIPYGETRTYGEIAQILKTSPRAVGNACRRNPLPIIIPCHRVVAANGIGGYDGARSGDLLKIKQRLLAREGVIF